MWKKVRSIWIFTEQLEMNKRKNCDNVDLLSADVWNRVYLNSYDAWTYISIHSIGNRQWNKKIITDWNQHLFRPNSTDMNSTEYTRHWFICFIYLQITLHSTSAAHLLRWVRQTEPSEEWYCRHPLAPNDPHGLSILTLLSTLLPALRQYPVFLGPRQPRGTPLTHCIQCIHSSLAVQSL